MVHLAELSNDPLCQHAPEKTYEINHRGSVALATAAKEAGVSRFVYASSCSIYGAAADGVRDEDSEPNPRTAYADCKRLVERDVQATASADFSPTFLRNATAFGASPRIRFDIVLSNLAGLAWTTGRITVTSDGMPWRPLFHVQDIAAAIARHAGSAAGGGGQPGPEGRRAALDAAGLGDGADLPDVGAVAVRYAVISVQ